MAPLDAWLLAAHRLIISALFVLAVFFEQVQKGFKFASKF